MDYSKLLTDYEKQLEKVENMVMKKVKPYDVSYIPYNTIVKKLRDVNEPSHLKIKDVIFNPPATIVFWEDGIKTVVKCTNEEFDPEKGLAMAISRRVLGNKYHYFDTFKKWTKRYYKDFNKCVAVGELAKVIYDGH